MLEMATAIHYTMTDATSRRYQYYTLLTNSRHMTSFRSMTDWSLMKP